MTVHVIYYFLAVLVIVLPFKLNLLWRMWRYQDTLKIKTTPKYVFDNNGNNPQIIVETYYIVTIDLPNGDFLEWHLDRHGTGAVAEPSVIGPIFITHYRPMLKWLPRLHTHNSGTNAALKIINLHSLNYLNNWMAQRVSNEKLVLHKLSE